MIESADTMSIRVSRSPAHRTARIAQDVAEEVLLQIKGLPGRVDRSPIVRALEGTLVALQRLQKSDLADQDHLQHLDAVRIEVKEAAEAIEGHDISPTALRMVGRLLGILRALEHAREATIDAIVATQQDVIGDELRGRAREKLPQLKPFAVSLGLPLLHTLEREPLRANVDVEAHEDYVLDDELDAEDAEDAEGEEIEHLDEELPDLPDDEEDHPPDSVDPAKRLAVLVDAPSEQVEATMVPGIDGELAQLERIARDCLEEISATANLRRLKDRERYVWSAMRGFEQRMCSCLDALVSLGTPFHMGVGLGARFGGLDILEQAAQYGRDAITADPGRAFARTFVLGSIAGEDTVRAALLALKQSHPYTHQAQARALSMAPNPSIDGALVKLCTDEDPRLVVVALDALYARGRADVASLVPLLEHMDETVRARAFRALGMADEQQAATKLLIDALDAETEDDVIAAAVEALVFQRAPEGISLARERLLEEAEEPGMLRSDVRTRFMQLIGVAGDANDYKLLTVLYAGMPGEALALAFHGHSELIEVLLDPLTEAERVLAGQEGQREAAEALYRITGAPMHAPNEPIDRYDIVTHGPTWRAWWEAHREGVFEAGVRYRFGEPFSGLHCVAELERDNVPVALRRMCALELGMLLGERPVMLHDFAARQSEAIAARRSSIEAAIHAEDPRFATGRWLSLG